MKSDPLPPVIYKYLDLKGAYAFLAEPQVRFKDFRELDDLMEVIPGFRELTESEVNIFAQQKYKELGGKISIEKCAFFFRTLTRIKGTYWEKEARKLIAELKAPFYICSLSERCDSGAMWGLYAERHQGIVFGISTAAKKLYDDKRVLTKQVQYSSERPQMPMPVVDENVVIQAIRTKSWDWQYQKEWRLMTVSSDLRKVALSREDVTEIVVGYRSPPDVVKLAEAYKVAGTQVYQAFPDPKFHSIARESL